MGSFWKTFSWLSNIIVVFVVYTCMILIRPKKGSIIVQSMTIVILAPWIINLFIIIIWL